MKFRRQHFYSAQSAFTMVEIAISLAVIGIALVAIIGVLPIGMNTQKDNREETIINQDATVFMDAIRSGARGPDDLTNYVYLITNSWTQFNLNGSVAKTGGNSYSYSSASVAPGFFTSFAAPINNGTNIIGLLSTPEYVNNNGVPIPNLLDGGYSNHVVAYVRSISGSAVEKPPQDNDILLNDSFSYKIYFDNVPVAVDALVWQSQQSYNAGDEVFYSEVFWRAITAGSGNTPEVTSSQWTQNAYAGQLTANLHELRLTFLWPLLPNGDTGGGRQSFRTMVGGQILFTNYTSVTPNQPLYFLQPQSFTNANTSP